MTPEELKAHLMRQVEALIDDLIARKPTSETITLSDIEQLAIGGGQEFRETVLQGLAQQSNQSENRETVACPTCGQAMHYKGKRGKDVVTEAGEVRVERDYYYCPGCQRGLFPPRPAVGAE